MYPCKVILVISVCVFISGSLFSQNKFPTLKSKLALSLYAGVDYSLSNSFSNEETSGGFDFNSGIPSKDLLTDFPYALELKIHYRINSKMQVGTGIGIHKNYYEVSFQSYKDPSARFITNEFSYLLHSISIPFVVRYALVKSRFVSLNIDGGVTFNINKVGIYGNSGRILTIYPDTTKFALNYSQQLELENKFSIGGSLGVDINPTFISKRIVLRPEIHVQRLNSFAFNQEMRLYNLDKGTEEYHFAKMNILPVFFSLKLGYFFKNSD